MTHSRRVHLGNRDSPQQLPRKHDQIPQLPLARVGEVRVGPSVRSYYHLAEGRLATDLVEVDSDERERLRQLVGYGDHLLVGAWPGKSGGRRHAVLVVRDQPLPVSVMEQEPRSPSSPSAQAGHCAVRHSTPCSKREDAPFRRSGTLRRRSEKVSWNSDSPPSPCCCLAEPTVEVSFYSPASRASSSPCR